MVTQSRFLSLYVFSRALFLPFFLLASAQLSLMHFWGCWECTFGRQMTSFQMIKPKSYFLGHWTLREQSQLDTNRPGIEKSEVGSGPTCGKPRRAVINMSELTASQTSLLRYDNDLIHACVSFGRGVCVWRIKTFEQSDIRPLPLK